MAQASITVTMLPRRMFPADGDYAKTSTANGANFDFTGDSTVTLWVYRTDGLDSSYHAMVSKRSGGNSEYNLYLEPVSSGVSKPHLYITMGSSTFNGSATDQSGYVVAYSWTSSIDGNLSTNLTFKSSNLSYGNHTIVFKAKNIASITSSI